MPNTRADSPKTLFTGWMLLTTTKPVMVSSTYGGHEPNFAVDETSDYWSAATGNSAMLQTDLWRRERCVRDSDQLFRPGRRVPRSRTHFSSIQTLLFR